MQLLEIIVFICVDFLLIIYGSRKGGGENTIYALSGASLLFYCLAQVASDNVVVAYSTLNPATGLYVDQNLTPISPILVLLGILIVLSFYASYRGR